ncbi:MAG: hypothetical protein J5884_00045 [Paludibacteraceae bacterium]|nr:hypothetical protein [Paludibacteraceae bacterium]
MRNILLSILLCAWVSAQAVNYCASSSWGYCGDITGGGNSTPTLVKSESELKSALKSSNKVILITQDITISDQLSTDKSNLTIMALPGVKLISTQQSKTVSGILYFKGSNIILRNLIFEGPGAYDCDGKDNLTLDGAKNVWVDHCDFQDGCDGNFDIKGLSDNITVTWCRFRYLKKPKAGGSGGSDDHRYSNLIGSSVSDKPSDGTYNITYGFCWWDDGCVERMTRCRNSELHFLNCYWNSSVSNYYVCPEYCSCYFEGCTFAGKANSNKKNFKEFKGTEGKNYAKFVNCSGNSLKDAGSVSAPSYSYDKLSAAEAKAYVINACGAGATLSVTEKAAVSSSCDSGQNPDPEDPQPEDPTVVSGDCCVDLSLGEEPSVANKGVPEEFSKLSILVNLEKGKWDAGYLNMGGNADYITFDFSAYQTSIVAVEFDVTIPLWAEGKNTISYHWNNEANTKYTIQSAATESVKLKAPASAKSFTIQRSASTGTRISKVCFQLQEDSEDPDPEDPEDPDHEAVPELSDPITAQKVLHEGQLLIIKNGKTFTVLGLNQ